MKGKMETGSKYKVNCETSLTIVEDLGWDNVIVRFDSGYVTKTQRSSILKGTVKDKLFRSVCGVGYLGDGEHSRVDHKIAYQTWVDMLKRAYTEKKGRCNYFGVTVCEEWHNFQSFAKWCHSQDFFNIKDKNGKRYEIDKDILVKGNKIYSPETCCFVPAEINSLLIRCGRARGDLYIGVYFSKKNKKYVSQIRYNSNQIHLGYFDTETEAFYAYKQAKESYIKEIANKWKDKIDHRVYEALMDYEVNIDD